MGLLRKAIFYLFVVIYVAVAPFTLLYALGYIFNPAEQTLLQTGLVSLGTEPAGANVWVNGSPAKEKTPTVLRNLKPGAYEIRVSLPGKRPWHRRVEVKPDLALRYEDILLFPLKMEAEILSDSPVSRMWYTEEGKHLVLLHGRHTQDLSLFELEQKRFRPIFPQDREREAAVEELFLHPSGDRALVALRKPRGMDYFLAKFLEPVQIHRLTNYLEPPLTGLRWNPNPRKSSFFYLQGDTLKHLDAEEGILYLNLGKRVRGFGLRGRRLFVLDGRRRFLELSEKGKVRSALLEEPARARGVFGPDEGERYSIFFLPKVSLFASLNEAFALFLSNRGRLFSNKLPYFLDEDVDEVALASSHPRVLYRKCSELWMIDFEKEREEGFFESGPTPRRIHEGKEGLGHLHWFYEDRYLLFLEGNRVMVQDSEGEEEAIPLFEVSSGVRELALDEARGFVYFAHPTRDRLARVKLFEARGILPRIVDDLVATERKSP